MSTLFSVFAVIPDPTRPAHLWLTMSGHHNGLGGRRSES